MSFNLGVVPYPLLSPFTDDFATDFRLCEIRQESFDPITVSADFEYSFSSGDLPELAYLGDLCDQGLAERVLLFESPESLHRSSERVGRQGSLRKGNGELYGRVAITPYVVAVQDIPNFNPPNRHGEWGDGIFTVHSGEILAIGDPDRIDISHKLARKQSMINLVLSTEMDPAVYRIDAGGDIIVVNAGSDIRRVIEIMKKDPSKKPALFMSLFKDVLQQGLLQARDSGGEQVWVRSLEQRLDIENLTEMTDEEIWDAPQRLLFDYGAKKILAEAEND
jgi:hypothetical protein